VERAEASPAVPNARRIIVTGILPPPDGLIDAIEGAGMRVAGNDVASQSRSYGHEAALTGDPAAFYCGAYRARRACTTLLYTADRRIDELCARAAERDARGVLFVGEKFCEYEYLELPYMRKILDEKKIAHMEIEIAAGDRDGAASLRTRVEAFAELLDH
ncbi:MAG TPA: 2-hydroxyacyl-CoA dehydratase family protein, partial [Spirochaetota bacterium]|nr:2-hydroxyacyl-CoA dehydratase family protein [Spirochaetota bacterium]